MLPTEFTVTVEDDAAVASDHVELAGVVEGTITNGGQAKVKLLNAAGEVVSEQEGADGSYKFTSVKAGHYTVEASKQGFVTNSSAQSFTVTKKADRTEDITLESLATTADVSGYVRTAGSLSAAEGAYQVVVRNGGSHETSVSTMTVSAGDDIENKNYLLETGGQAELALSFVDSEGNELEGLNITASLYDAYADKQAATEVGVSQLNSPTLTFDQLSSGNYSLVLEADGYRDVTTNVSLTKNEQKEAVVTLSEIAEEHAVSVRVLNETSANEPAAKVVVLDKDGKITATLVDGTDGVYAGQLVDGEYQVAVFKHGYIVAKSTFTVNGEDVTLPAVQLRK